MNRPRVLHIGKFYPPYKGGMETHLQDLCRALTAAVDVEVIVANSENRTQFDYDGDVRINRMATVAKISSAPICAGMISAIRRTPTDIVHLHSPNPTAVLSYLASRHPAKLVVTHHSDIVHQRFLKPAFEPWLRMLMNRAAAVICFSPDYMRTSPVLKRHWGKCHVISHGVDPASFRNADAAVVADVQEKYGPNIVLALGRLVYYKGFEYLIKAIKGTNATLLIIGTGPLRQQLIETAHMSGVSHQVHFLGEVPEAFPYYQAARIFVLPSIARSEAFGIVQLEAMMCGTPVINTSLRSGVPFVSLNEVSGLTVPPANVPALREAIIRLLTDDALRQRLSIGAQQRVAENFSLRNMVDRTLNLYATVLQAPDCLRSEYESERLLTPDQLCAAESSLR